MPYMVEDGEGASGLRIQCPNQRCEYELLEPEWTTSPTTDHCCPNGHWFRVEGDDPDDLDNFAFHEIDPAELLVENCQ